MSHYTEAVHTAALIETKNWIAHPPVSAQDFYLYGQYHFRLKDYSEAFHWFLHAATNGCTDAWFDIAVCLDKNLLSLEEQSVLPAHTDPGSLAFLYYQQKAENTTKEALTLYRLAFLYRYGIGTQSNPIAAQELFTEASILAEKTDPFTAGSCLYEIALYYANGIAGVTADSLTARKLLRESYAMGCADALRYDYEQYCSDYTVYDLQDDIRELYSFELGQHVRVHELRPTEKTRERVLAFYEQGYPGDSEDRRLAFAKKGWLLFPEPS